MKNLTLSLLAAIFVCGCSSQQPAASTAPREGTLKMDNLTPEQQIEKVKKDPSIPEQYKQTFINSVRSKQGLAPIKSPAQEGAGK